MFNPEEHFMDLKGKKYLQVMWRLVWFREEKPLWCIDTELKELTENHAVFCAKIFDENGALKASGYGSEGVKDFRDFIEKAETKAIGRALAMLGYGTQFAPELDEGERIVDSPVKPNKPTATQRKEETANYTCADCGAEIKPFKSATGKEWTSAELAERSIKKFGVCVCTKCGAMRNKAGEANVS